MQGIVAGIFLLVAGFTCAAGSEAGAIIKLSTEAGVIRIRMHEELSPESVEYITKLASMPELAQHGSNAGRGCSFYRLEPAPAPGSEGPPYGLLQGSLAAEGVTSLQKAPNSVEGKKRPELQVGSVAWAGGGLGPDFFISLVAHPEWKHDHNVWGEVEDMSELDGILKLPTKAANWGQTKVQVLKAVLPFNVTAVNHHRQKKNLRHRHSKRWRRRHRHAHHKDGLGSRRSRRRRHRHKAAEAKDAAAD
jgi:cyclophilin family peptidyl-prolyl cis-trans isomerase